MKELKRGRPGRRFQDHYSRRHDAHGGERTKPAFIWGGVALVLVGFVLSFWPLFPGSLLMLLGAAAIATKSKTAAKGFDWAEARVREHARRIRRWPWVVRIVTQPSIDKSLSPEQVAGIALAANLGITSRKGFAMASVVQEPQYNRRITDRGRPLGMYAALLGGQGLRVSWGGIWSGVLLSTGLLIILAALGAAIGISAVQPGESEASTFATGAGIYAAISLLVALFVGGWASTRLGGIWDRATGLCEGALVWVVSLLLMGYLATSGISTLASGAFKLVGGAAQTVTSVMQGESGGTDVSGNVDQILQRLRDPNTAQQIAQATGMQQNEVQQSLGQTADKVQAARDNPGQAAQEAKQGVSQLMERAKSSGAIQQKAEEVKPAAAKAAWITLGALLLSLICAVLGALAGRRDPDIVPAR